ATSPARSFPPSPCENLQMPTAGPRPTIRWRTVRVDPPVWPCVLGDGGLRRHSRVRARVGDRLAAAATGAPARLRAALASVHRHGGRRSSAAPPSPPPGQGPHTPRAPGTLHWRRLGLAR